MSVEQLIGCPFWWHLATIEVFEKLNARYSYFRFMEPTGIIKPGSNLRDGIFDSKLDPMAHQGIGGTLSEDSNEVDILVAAHTTPEYLAFSQHPALKAFVRKLMGWSEDVECVRTLVRHNLPHSASTAIHYDKIFLRASESYFLTAWVPIGDCAADGGGLLYLEDSSTLGLDIEKDFSARAQVLPPEERISAYNAHMTSTGAISQDAATFGREEGGGRRWLTADYEAGDVVFHNPYIIHASGKNEDSLGRIRLSTDLRFYEKGVPIDERWMNTWKPGDGL